MSLVMIDYFKLVALIARWIKIFFVIQELQWLGQTKLKNLRKQEWSYSVSILVFWLQLGWSAEVILCPKVEVILYSWNSLKIKNTKACLSRFFVFNCSRNLLVHCCSFNCKKLVFLFVQIYLIRFDKFIVKRWSLWYYWCHFKFTHLACIIYSIY